MADTDEVVQLRLLRALKRRLGCGSWLVIGSGSCQASATS